ncbi:hypothetical protein EV175_001156 [Coemansia sp. RSA 1933]|nr:hypothetical protein EV175_001156 [Coemansia sp. RSA 1933]
MFSPYGSTSSGAIRAKKRRCPVCGSKRMAARDDGRVTCRYGHEQAGIFEESTELLVSGSIRRHTAKPRRESKRKRLQNRRLYGRNAHFLILQGMQHILKLQAETLVRDLGAPDALVAAVRDIWLLYISQLDHQDSLDPTLHQDYHNNNSNNNDPHQETSASAANTQRHTDLSANSLYTQHLTQTQGSSAVDDSIDDLLKQIDADIAEDEEDIIAWQRRNENRAASLLNNSPQVPSERERPAEHEAGHLSSISPLASSRVVSAIKRFVRMECLPAILYLAFLWIHAPITHGDLHYIIAEERIPYVSAYLRLPDQIHSRLGQGLSSIFIVPFAPSITRIKTLSAAFQSLFLTTMGITFPQQTLPQQMVMLVKRLNLPLNFYHIAMRAIELIGNDVYMRVSRRGPTTVSMAAIVVCLKLHYGLDEIERQSTNTDDSAELAPDLPPLHDFLDSWRDAWESEMSIGVIPHLTAYGSCWSHQFAEYYKRLVSRDHIKRYRAVYRDLSRRYRNTIEHLATRDQMDDPQVAQSMLPYEYITRRRQKKPPNKRGRRPKAKSDQQEELPEKRSSQSSTSLENLSSDVEELKKYIEPVNIAAVYDKNTRMAMRSKTRPPPTIVAPLDGCTQIQLEPGEKYMLLHPDHTHTVYGDGYTMPTFGLIVARCAMILGCTPDVLIQSIVHLEHWLMYSTK